MDISIIIVNYKSKGLTLNCIKSIQEADFKDLRHEIIVVDNNSDDTLGEILAWQYPEVVFIKSDRNRGMGGGNNIGIARAQGTYIVIMNPDTIAFPDTFTRLYTFMEKNPRVGIAGPQQFNPDQSIQDSRYRWHSLLMPLYRRTFLGTFSFAKRATDYFLMHDVPKNVVHPVDWLLGSCLFIRSKFLREVGNFDERFFLYFEDTDLCRRFWQKKFQVVYFPDARIIHNHNRASADRAWYAFFLNPAGRRHLGSWFRYLSKWGIRRPLDISIEG